MMILRPAPIPAPSSMIRQAPRAHRCLVLVLTPLLLPGCAAMGSLMSPYPEGFSCKNDDHGQCIHPEQAFEDAAAGRSSRSQPAVTNDPGLLKARAATARPGPAARQTGNAYAGYRDSLYQELKGLIDAPVTPMLKPAQAVRTLILPYADRLRPDRLYMPRYVYSIIDRPVWVVGGYLVEPALSARAAPVLGQLRDPPGAVEDRGAPTEIILPAPAPAPDPASRPDEPRP